jgi:hypothetical protein
MSTAPTQDAAMSALHAAIAAHLAHPAGALSDCGTEAMCDEVLQAQAEHLTPAERVAADAQLSDLPTSAGWLLLYAAVAAATVVLSAFYPAGWPV